MATGRERVKSKPGGSGRAGRRWLLAGVSLFLLLETTPGAARSEGSEAEDTTPRRTVAQAETTYSFDIPSKPLPQALADFSAVTGLQVLYTEASAFDVTVPALEGTFTARQALDRLLAGSGLVGRFTSADAVTLERAAPQVDEGPMRLAPIIVEGGKVARDYVDTPSSVGIVTGEDVETYGVDDLRDGFNQLGNVRWFEGNRSNAGIVIRGINSEGATEPTNNAPVASIIIDGATQSVESTRRGARGIWDIKQIEVFRGPQSTLQGRGALAGAVIVETNDPTFFWEAGAQGVLAEDSRRDGAFFLSGPVIEDQVAFRISGEARERDVEIDYNVENNEEFAEDRYRNIRGKLLVEPEALPELSVLFTASRTFDKPAVRAVNGDNFLDREFLSAPTTAVEQREATNNNYVLEVSYELTDWLLARSISSKIDSEMEISTPSGLSFQRDESREGDDFTQDLRFEIGETADTISGVVGGFYGDFSLPRESLVTAGTLVFQDLESDDETQTASVYADMRFRFLPSWSLLLGGRYTNETVRNKSQGVTTSGVQDIDAQAEFDVFLPKAGIAYDIADNQSLAFTAQRGYRSGFTTFQGDQVVDVDPEYLWSFELAYRAQSDQGRWSFGATAFYYRYRDQQITVLRNPGTVNQFGETVNAGRSRSFGGELEGRYGFDFGLDVFGAVGLLDTEFDRLETSRGDFSGNEFAEAPSITASLGASFQLPAGFFAAARFSYTDDYFSNGTISNDDQLEIDSFWELDLRAGYRTDNVSVTFFADNVFDRDYITSLSNNDNFGTPPVEATIADGRKFGVEVSLLF